MKYFFLNKDKIVTNTYLDRPISRVWVYAGVYPIIREFDNDRWLVDVGRSNTKLSLLRKQLGQTTNDAF